MEKLTSMTRWCHQPEKLGVLSCLSGFRGIIQVPLSHEKIDPVIERSSLS